MSSKETSNPFKWVESITYVKNDMMESEESVKDYNSYMVNRALSFHMDCVLFANEMNGKWQLPNDMQYRYLMQAIRPKRRFSGKWPKKIAEDFTKAVSKYYGVGSREAAEIVTVLTNEQLDMIRTELESREGTS